MQERRPSLYDVGDEPDPRYTLANERTFLAWVRTALAMLAGAVALDSLGIPDNDLLRGAIVVALALSAGATCALSWVRWTRVERAMRLREALPRFNLGLAVAVGMVLVSVLLAVVLVI